MSSTPTSLGLLRKSLSRGSRVIDLPSRSVAASSVVSPTKVCGNSPKRGTRTPTILSIHHIDEGLPTSYRALIVVQSLIAMSVITAVDPSMDGALDQITNESGSPPPSPPSATAKMGPVLRHKSTHHGPNPDVDSSESYPSPHSSIYEASLIHQSDGKEDSIPPYTNDDGLPPWNNIVSDASGNPVPVSFHQAPPNKNTHVPHELYTITEKSSLATIRASLSLRDQGSVSTLRLLSPGLNGKKSKAFSLSDLPPTPERRSPPASTPPTPLQPGKPPPESVPTPPGLPTFGQPEAVNYRLPPPKSRFRDNFRTPTPEQREYTRQTVGLPKGVVMRSENGVVVRGRFIPIVSGHFPPQRQVHAVFRAPHQAYTAAPDPQAPAREGPSPVHRANETPASHRTDRQQVEKAQRRKDDRKKAYLADLCCGLCSCLYEDSAADTPAPTVVPRGAVQWDVQPPSIRARYCHNFQGRGRTLN